MAKSAQTNKTHGVGRRKSSVARVWIGQGTGAVTVNGRSLEHYFPTIGTRQTVLHPGQLTGRSKDIDVTVNVAGGGYVSQAGAIRLGIARALVEADIALRPTLKKSGLLRCDARVKERKKYGQRGARRKFQFVKR